MSQKTVTEMESETLSTLINHIDDAALAMHKSSQVEFVISMCSIYRSLRGDSFHEHIAETLSV